MRLYFCVVKLPDDDHILVEKVALLLYLIEIPINNIVVCS
jgi:hypothetical protein